MPRQATTPPKYGHRSATPLEPNGEEAMAERHKSGLCAGTSALLTEHVHLAGGSGATATAPPAAAASSQKTSPGRPRITT
eukprot:15449639-Alexandrium_andersonii.AAC.2